MVVAAALAACGALAPVARAASANVAALQAGLFARGLYTSNVDGLRGPATSAAVRALQRRAGLVIDGIPGPRTRRALGRHGRHRYGSRALRPGLIGWDVAALQFLLESHGFALGVVDGGSARAPPPRCSASRRAGSASTASPGRRRWPPCAARRRARRCPSRGRSPPPIGDGFGPRGAGFHEGVDFPAATGTAVFAAGRGRVEIGGLRRRLRQARRSPAPIRRRDAVRAPVLDRGRRARRSRPAASSGASARPATPPARTCTSRSLRGPNVNPLTALRSTRRPARGLRRHGAAGAGTSRHHGAWSRGHEAVGCPRAAFPPSARVGRPACVSAANLRTAAKESVRTFAGRYFRENFAHTRR